MFDVHGVLGLEGVDVVSRYTTYMDRVGFVFGRRSDGRHSEDNLRQTTVLSTIGLHRASIEYHLHSRSPETSIITTLAYSLLCFGAVHPAAFNILTAVSFLVTDAV